MKNSARLPVTPLVTARLALSAMVLAFLPQCLLAEEADNSKTLEEIVVTARYKEENLQEAPLAVTAFSEDMLDKLIAQDLRDVGPATPNVHIQPVVTFPNSAAIHIRGMGSQNIESTNEMRAGVSINGVFVSRPIATLIDFFDVERVEVLRGPQGTTFGKNSLAGGLNIATIRPDGSKDWKTELVTGNDGRLDFRGAVQFPIVDGKLSARLSGISQNYDGFFTNRVNGDNLNGEDILALRATFVWTPTENLEATLITHWLEERSDAPGGDNDPDPFQILLFTGPNDDTFTVGRDALSFHDTDQLGATILIDWDLGDFILSSITGYQETDGLIASDFDQTEIPFFPTFRDQVHDQLSQEIRLQSDFSGKEGVMSNLDLVVGLYFFTQEHELVQSFPTLGPSADYAHQDGDSSALFAQGIYAINERTNFTLGVRYTKEEKEFDRNSGTVMPGLDAQNPATRPSISAQSQLPKDVVGDLDSSNTTFKTGIDYQWSDNLLAYATYAQGFKAGEFGARAGSLTTVGPTDDEESDSFEFGIKSDWMDNRLRLNVAVFHTVYENLQFGVFFPSPTNPTGQETAAQNIGEATIQGIEIELTSMPMDGLTLQANLGFLDGEYDKFCADLDGPSIFFGVPTSTCGQVSLLPSGGYLVDEDHTNLELSRAPETQAYISADYVYPMSAGDIFVRLSGSFESEYFSDGVLNNPKAETGDFWLWDFNAGWQSPGESWRVTAWCKNCSNKEYTSGLTAVANFFNQKFWGNPRAYGLTLSARM